MGGGAPKCVARGRRVRASRTSSSGRGGAGERPRCTRGRVARGPAWHEAPRCTRARVARARCHRTRSHVARGSVLRKGPCCTRIRVAQGPVLHEAPRCTRPPLPGPSRPCLLHVLRQDAREGGTRATCRTRATLSHKAGRRTRAERRPRLPSRKAVRCTRPPLHQASHEELRWPGLCFARGGGDGSA